MTLNEKHREKHEIKIEVAIHQIAKTELFLRHFSP
jgi:hypothetical protein